MESKIVKEYLESLIEQIKLLGDFNCAINVLDTNQIVVLNGMTAPTESITIISSFLGSSWIGEVALIDVDIIYLVFSNKNLEIEIRSKNLETLL